MNISVVTSPKGNLSVALLSQESQIKDTSDFLDFMANADADVLALEKSSLPPDFFELRSGIAGEFLQKLTNYQRKLIVLGDFQNIQSNSLKSFIVEANRSGRTVFAESLDQAFDLIR